MDIDDNITVALKYWLNGEMHDLTEVALHGVNKANIAIFVHDAVEIVHQQDLRHISESMYFK